MNYIKLEKKAKKLRQDTFLAFIQKGEAHLGGSFSMIEILISLFDVIMKKEDKFIIPFIIVVYILFSIYVFYNLIKIFKQKSKKETFLNKVNSTSILPKKSKSLMSRCPNCNCIRSYR